MSSTSSRDQSSASATETLASRYRHLFVLPSAARLFAYGALATVGIVLISGGPASALSSLPAFVVFILSSAAIASALRIADRNTIATVRRVSALLLAGELLWLIFAVLGAVYSQVARAPSALTNALIFGSFICAGLEFLVINGTFAKNVALSLMLAALHPASTLLILRYGALGSGVDPLPVAFGAISLAIVVGFPLSLQRRKTSLGHSALGLFQAFMKTWTAAYPEDLERIIADHAESAVVSTKVLRFRTSTTDVILVFPGVHPGPFHPVGSYDLPGVLAGAMKGTEVMTLHRPGGHERNLATRSDTLKYAEEVRELAASIKVASGRATVRGPVWAQVLKAKASVTAFAEDAMLTISFAPLGSDDLDTRVEDDLARAAAASGFELSVVDAHNSIDRGLESPVTSDPGWGELFSRVNAMEPERFSVAYAHSRELGFKGGRDLTDVGVGLFMMQSGGDISVLILADANNAVPGLREEVSKALDAAGYRLIELCTSDTHNLAALGMTVERGYEALGESTPTSALAGLAVNLARLAEPRLSPADYGSARSKSQVRVFGSKALSEFASLTQASSRYASKYFKAAAGSVALLFLLSLLL